MEIGSVGRSSLIMFETQKIVWFCVVEFFSTIYNIIARNFVSARFTTVLNFFISLKFLIILYIYSFLNISYHFLNILYIGYI